MASFELTESEAERYDRQIRVWGAEAQARIQSSKVLVCGISNVNVEVVKNIVLAGMTVTIQSSRCVTYDDLAHNFFLTVDDVGKPMLPAAVPRVQELNSFVKVEQESRALEELTDDFFESFDVVLLVECSEVQALRINALCRRREPHAVFFWSDVFGESGVFIADFGDKFVYKPDQQAKNIRDEGSAQNGGGSNGGSSKMVIDFVDETSNSSSSGSSSSSSSSSNSTAGGLKTITFPPLKQVLEKKWCGIASRHFPLSPVFITSRLLTTFRDANGRHPSTDDKKALSDLLKDMQAANDMPLEQPLLSEIEIHQLAELSGAASVLSCSVLGSFLSQEVIKAVSRSGQPAFNVFLFSGNDFSAKAVPIQ